MNYKRRNQIGLKGLILELSRMGIESAVMYFGKYKGQPLSEVPLDYLQWLKEKDRLRGCELGFGGT